MSSTSEFIGNSRNLSKHYLHFRGIHRASQNSTELTVDQKILRAKLASSVVFPEYTKIVNYTINEIGLLKRKIRDLSSLHQARSKIIFDENKQLELDQEIDDLTSAINKSILDCENCIKKISSVDNDGQLIQQERIIRKNAMTALAMDLANTAKTLRKEQREFRKQLQKQENNNIPNEPGSKNNNTTMTAIQQEIIEKLDAGEQLNQEQKTELAMMEIHSTARDLKIIQLAKSVNELARLFNELYAITIQQDSVLNRIDHNVEQALEEVKTGTVIIGKIPSTGVSTSTKCIGSLILVIIILILVIIIKKSI